MEFRMHAVTIDNGTPSVTIGRVWIDVVHIGSRLEQAPALHRTRTRWKDLEPDGIGDLEEDLTILTHLGVDDMKLTGSEHVREDLRVAVVHRDVHVERDILVCLALLGPVHVVGTNQNLGPANDPEGALCMQPISNTAPLEPDLDHVQGSAEVDHAAALEGAHRGREIGE